jgi:predicted transcriptional regulator
MTTTSIPIEALRGLGFTEIEALVYVFLLQNEPSTGYRVSHEIGKPTANTYKAIVSLEQRGAVQVDDGENRLVRAVPPEELLGQMERRFRDQRESAAQALADIRRDAADDRVYALKSAAQVLERARSMLAEARGIVLADCFPRVFDALRDDLAAAAARGVAVTVKVYAEVQAPGVEVILQPGARRTFERWPGQQLSLVVDAEEHLLALFTDDLERVHQAVWSRSTFLSCLHHNHLAMEHLVTLYSATRETSLAAADAAFQTHLDLPILHAQPQGLARLRERYGVPSSPEAS